MGGKSSKDIHRQLHVCEGSSNCSRASASSMSAPQPPDYKKIGDDFKSLDQITQALQEAGLESSNLIVGIDFTASNEWTGKRSFMGRNLHHLGRNCPNPYEQAISIIGRTLKRFDEDDRIPCYGFGDETTGDQEVFSFHPNDTPCHGFGEVLSCYRNLLPHVKLAGPTSFGPIIRTAIRIVNASNGKYHILMIIADGQVTRSADTPEVHLSLQEESTFAAIVEASKYPLSIIIVGVGDGPWDQMYEFDDDIRTRDFDNVQFVNFTEIMGENIPMSKKETLFALNSLMEIPAQYKATLSLQLLGKGKETQGRFSLPQPPPIHNIWHTNTYRNEPGSGLSYPLNHNISHTNSYRNEPGSGLSSPLNPNISHKNNYRNEPDSGLSSPLNPNISHTNSYINESGSGLSSPLNPNISHTNSYRNEPGSGLSSPLNPNISHTNNYRNEPGSGLSSTLNPNIWYTNSYRNEPGSGPSSLINPNICHTKSYRNEPSSGLSSPVNPNISCTNSYRNEPSSGFSYPSQSEYPSPPPPSLSSSFDMMCSNCYLREIDLMFGCGHQTCSDCGEDMDFCPACHTQITTKIMMLD